MRIEHWTNAVDQAACVAHNITHPDDLRSYEPVEYVWSDQYDWKIQVAGRTTGLETISLSADPVNDNRFAALYTEGEQQLTGAAIVNWPRALIECRRALQAGSNLESCRQARGLGEPTEYRRPPAMMTSLVWQGAGREAPTAPELRCRISAEQMPSLLRAERLPRASAAPAGSRAHFTVGVWLGRRTQGKPVPRSRTRTPDIEPRQESLSRTATALLTRSIRCH